MIMIVAGSYHQNMSRIVRLPALTLVAVAVLMAAGSADWSSLAGLKAGDIIEVRQSGRSNVTGTYHSNSPDGLTLELAGADRTLPKGGITRVALIGKTHRVRNGIILGLVGGLAGAGSYKFGYACAETANGCSRARVVSSAGAAGGAIIGALLPARKTVIYRAGK